MVSSQYVEQFFISSLLSNMAHFSSVKCYWSVLNKEKGNISVFDGQVNVARRQTQYLFQHLCVFSVQLIDHEPLSVVILKKVSRACLFELHIVFVIDLILHHKQFPPIFCF